MAGPNYGLDKGYKVAIDSDPVKEFEAAVLVDAITVKRADTAGQRCLGVFQYDMYPEDVATGKAAVGVRMEGISRGIAGAAIPVDARVACDVDGRFVSAEGGGAGTTANIVGRALTPASSAGDQFDLWLSPNAQASF